MSGSWTSFFLQKLVGLFSLKRGKRDLQASGLQWAFENVTGGWRWDRPNNLCFSASCFSFMLHRMRANQQNIEDIFTHFFLKKKSAWIQLLSTWRFKLVNIGLGQQAFNKLSFLQPNKETSERNTFEEECQRLDLPGLSLSDKPVDVCLNPNGLQLPQNILQISPLLLER